MSMKHAALALAALTLAPLAAQAQQNTNAAQVPVLTTLPAAPAAPAAKGKQLDAPLTIKPVKASEKDKLADLSGLNTIDYSPTARGQGWHRDPGHFYDGRGVDCSAYPTRCR